MTPRHSELKKPSNWTKVGPAKDKHQESSFKVHAVRFKWNSPSHGLCMMQQITTIVSGYLKQANFEKCEQTR